MADDIITFGRPERRSRRDADEAIESLFHAHYPRMVYTAFFLAGDSDLAEQLAQEAYLRLWRSWRRISDPRAATMYLQRTVVNLARESIRRRMIERRVPKARSMERPPATEPDAAAVLELRRAIAALPERKRECVVLRHLLGLSESETAELLGVSVGTLKSQTHQGLRQLRELLDELAAGSGAGSAGGSGRAGDQTGEDRDLAGTELERQLRDMRLPELPSGTARRPVDTARAWSEFRALRSRSAAIRRRALAAAGAAAAIVIAIPALAGGRPGSQAPVQPNVSSSLLAATRTYPGAVAARMAMSGVTAVVGDAGHAWVIRTIGQPGFATTYQLAGIDLRTNAIIFRADLGHQPRAIAAGAGRVWLTTSYSQAGGQIVRVNPATGQILSMIHIPAGPCTAISFSSAHLFASCNVGGRRRNAIWRINPVTQRVFRLTGTLHGYISSLTAAPRGLWYVVDFSRIAGLTNTGGNPQPVTARDPGSENPPPGGQGLVYDSGSIWALSGGERLIQIDALNGRVMQVFTYRNYDPRRAGGLDFLTAGGGWLWFLDNGYPFSDVLRVGETTARPAGGVAIAPNSCGQQVCSQIFYTPGSVWVPTAELLLRIDTSRLPS